MKKIYYSLLISILLIGMLSFLNVVNAANEVTDRELALAASYSYMPWFQEGKKITRGFDIGKFKGISTIANSINSKFNLHNYATAEELDEFIVDDFNGLKALAQNGLNVLRLKRDNDIIIVINGTASPVDAFEDIKYGIRNYNNQEKHLKKYIASTLEEYSKKSGNYKIYVTGHSLGGYLAQIGGAEVEDLIIKNKYKNLKLVKIADFNGIGINFLTALGEKINYGSKEGTINTLKKLGEEGRLVEYYVYGDLVSSLGVHYGEMRMVLPSLDSITYHRSNYRFLSSFGKKLVNACGKQTPINSFKTNLEGADDLYQVNNIAAYLNLTHESDHFVTLEPNTSKNKPEVKIIQDSLGALSSHVTSSKSSISITHSTTIKALTSFASAKKYEWYESDDNKNWTLIKTVDLYNLNGEKPTNTLDIKASSIPAGKTKYYKVLSYYDDNYVSSKYNYNNKIKQYEYVETDKSRTTEYEPISATIKVTHKKSLLSNLFSNKLSLIRK